MNQAVHSVSPLRIHRFSRFIYFRLPLAVLVFLFVFAIYLFDHASQGQPVKAQVPHETAHLSDMQRQVPVQYVVLQGDTLWSIASRYKPPAKNVRQYIDEIKTLNQLRSSMLSIGQVIVLP